MSHHLICTVAMAIFMSAGFATAQPAEKKELPKGPDKASLIIKNDPTSLPTGARLRLGSLGGYRYAGSVASACMSLDGKWLAVVEPSGNSINIVEIATGKSVQQIKAQFFGNPQLGMSFSADGTALAVQTFQDVRVWEVASGKLLRNSQSRDSGGQLRAPSLSADGKMVAGGGERFGGKQQTGEVRAIEVASGKIIGPFTTVHNYNIAAAISPDGKTLASWGGYLDRGGGGQAEREIPRTLQLWDLAAGKEQSKIKLDFGPQSYNQVRDAVFSPDGKTLAVSSGMSTFHLIDVESGKETRRFFGQRGGFGGGGGGGGFSFQFSPDGSVLASHDRYGGAVQAWEVKTGKRLDLIDGPKSQILGFAFPGNDRIVVLGNLAQTLYWWDANIADKDSLFHGHLKPVVAIAFLSDGKSILTAAAEQSFNTNGDHSFIWWDAETGKEQKRLRIVDDDSRFGGGNRSSFALSPDGRFAATASANGNTGVRLWSLKTGRPVFDFEGPRAYDPMGLAFASDSSKLVAADTQVPLYLWDTSTGQEVRRLGAAVPGNQRFSNLPSRAAIAADGKTLAVHSAMMGPQGRDMSELVVWNIGAAKEIRRIELPLASFAYSGNDPTGGLAYSTDGLHLAYSDGKGAIAVFEVSHRQRGQKVFHAAPRLHAANRILSRRPIPRCRLVAVTTIQSPLRQGPAADRTRHRNLGNRHRQGARSLSGAYRPHHMRGLCARWRNAGFRKPGHDGYPVGLCGQACQAHSFVERGSARCLEITAWR